MRQIHKAKAAALTVLALSFLAGGSVAAGKVKRIVGRVVSIESDVLVVRTRRAETVAIEIDATTRYSKWITQKPWQQSTRANASLLRVGRLVDVEAVPGERTIRARRIRIASD